MNINDLIAMMVNYYLIKESIQDLLADINDKRLDYEGIEIELFKILKYYKTSEEYEKRIRDFIQNNRIY